MNNNIGYNKDGSSKCFKCGKENLRGIVEISEHWSNCTGKEFMNEFKKLLKKYGKN